MIRTLLRICATLAIIWLTSRIAASALPIAPGDIGTRDGIQYWSSFQLLLSGENPYDPQAVLDLEATLGRHEEQPIMSRNPPWVGVFLSPIMWGSFSQAMWAWRIVQLLLVIGMYKILVPPNVPREQKIVSGVTLGAFYPLLDSFYSGQLGIALAFGVALIIKQRVFSPSFRSFGALILFLAKPHLFLPLFSYLLWTRSRLLLLSICACIVATLLPLGASPISYWLESIYAPLHPEMLTHIFDFRSNVLCSWTRGVLFDAGLGRCVWVIPAFAGVSLLSGLVIKRRTNGFEHDVPTLILLGLLLAPYGWMSDYSILAPLIIGPIANLALSSQRLKAIVLCVVSAGSVIIFGNIAHACAWVLVMLCRCLRLA